MGQKYIVKVAVTDRPDDQGAIGATADTNSKARSFVLQQKIDPAAVEEIVAKAISDMVAKLSKKGTLFEEKD